MSDLIRRKDALYQIWDWVTKREYEHTNATYWLQKRIEAIPSADRPQGEWEDTGKDPSHSHPLTAIWYRCSECGYGTNAKTNFCPDCGAEMKGEDDE